MFFHALDHIQLIKVIKLELACPQPWKLSCVLAASSAQKIQSGKIKKQVLKQMNKLMIIDFFQRST